MDVQGKMGIEDYVKNVWSIMPALRKLQLIIVRLIPYSSHIAGLIQIKRRY